MHGCKIEVNAVGFVSLFSFSDRTFPLNKKRHFFIPKSGIIFDKQFAIKSGIDFCPTCAEVGNLTSAQLGQKLKALGNSKLEAGTLTSRQLGTKFYKKMMY